MSTGPGSDLVQRAEVSYQPLYQRFLIRDRDYKKQYSHMYTRRLAALRPVVLRSAEERWAGQSGGLNVCSKIIDLRAGATTSSSASSVEGGAQVVVSGCIFKQQQLKPSILDNYRGDRAVTVKDRANFTSDSDSLVLEDESGRVILAPGLYTPPASEGGAGAVGGPWPQPYPLAKLVKALVTGVVVAVLGRVVETGELRVDDVCVSGWTRVPGPGESEGSVPGPLPWPARPPAGEQPIYVLLLSGLRFASNSAHPMALQLLCQWLSGITGGGSSGMAAGRVARVVIAGGLLGATPTSVQGHGKSASSAGAGAASSKEASFGDRNVAAAESEALAGPIRDADAWLCSLAACAPVDLMPGALDPCTQSLPQQPLHPILLPSAGRYGSLRCVSNPYDCSIGGVRLLGHSGQALTDVARCAASSHVTQPGDEAGILAEAQGRGRGRKSLGGSASASASAGSHVASLSSPPMSQDISLGLSSQAMDVDGAGAGAAGDAISAGEATDAALAGLRTSADDEDEGVGSEEVAAALSGTSGDKALGALATGAGAGFEARAAAGGDGSEVVASLSPLDLLHNTWVWRHMAPTAPDTLPSYPFVGADPFIIESDSFPHVFFAGCQRAFGTRLARGPDTSAVRLITVPDFASTHTAVLLELTSPTLEATPISFAVGGLERASAQQGQGSMPQGQGLKLRVVK